MLNKCLVITQDNWSFIQQIFIQCELHARHCSRDLDRVVNTKIPALMKFIFQWETYMKHGLSKIYSVSDGDR